MIDMYHCEECDYTEPAAYCYGCLDYVVPVDGICDACGEETQEPGDYDEANYDRWFEARAGEKS